MEKVTYITEDGAEVSAGDRVYNYYDMQPGIIGRDHGSGWFDFQQDNGRIKSLNGQRVCTLETARRRGFPGAEL